MEKSVFKELKKLITLQKNHENVESQIGEFVEENLKNILVEITADGDWDALDEFEEGEYRVYIDLNDTHNVVADGETYTACTIIYETKQDTVYLEVEDDDIFIEFLDIEPAQQLEIILDIVKRFFAY